MIATDIAGWLPELQGKGCELAVLVAYAAHANAEGDRSHPGPARLAAMTGYDLGSVRRARRRLRTIGALVKVGTTPTKFGPQNVYKIPKRRPIAGEAPRVAREPGYTQAPPVTHDRTGGHTRPEVGSHTTPKQTNQQTPTNEARRATVVDGLLEQYEEHRRRLLGRNVGVLTASSHRRAIERRLAQGATRDYLRECIDARSWEINREGGQESKRWKYFNPAHFFADGKPWEITQQLVDQHRETTEVGPSGDSSDHVPSWEQERIEDEAHLRLVEARGGEA